MSKCNVCHYNRKNIPAPWAKCLKMAHSSDCPACPHVDTSNICKKINLVSNNVLDKNSFQNSSKMKISSQLKGRKWRTTTLKRYIQERDDRNCFPTIDIEIKQYGGDPALHIYFFSNIKCKIWFFIYKASDWDNWEKAQNGGTSITRDNPITKDMLIEEKINVINKENSDSTYTYISLGDYYKGAPDNEKWKIYNKDNVKYKKQTTPLTAILEGKVTTHISIGHQPFTHKTFGCKDSDDFTMYYVTQGIDNKVRHPRTRILRVMNPPLTTPLYSQPFEFKEFIYIYYSLNLWNIQVEKCCISSIYFMKGWDNKNDTGSNPVTTPVTYNENKYKIIGKESDKILNLDIFNKIYESDSQPFDPSNIYALHQCNTFDSLEYITIFMPYIESIINVPTSLTTPQPNYKRKVLKNLKTIKIDENNNLKEIGENCFEGFTNLETFNIITNQSLFTINTSAFNDCSGLKTVDIVLTNEDPNIIFGDSSFANTINLKYVHISSSLGNKIKISLGNNVFSNSTLEYIGDDV